MAGTPSGAARRGRGIALSRYGAAWNYGIIYRMAVGIPCYISIRGSHARRVRFPTSTGESLVGVYPLLWFKMGNYFRRSEMTGAVGPAGDVRIA